MNQSDLEHALNISNKLKEMKSAKYDFAVNNNFYIRFGVMEIEFRGCNLQIGKEDIEKAFDTNISRLEADLQSLGVSLDVKNMDDILKGFDAGAHREAVGAWTNDPPVGKEIL